LLKVYGVLYIQHLLARKIKKYNKKNITIMTVGGKEEKGYSKQRNRIIEKGI
jgi:hypothetical protein